MKEQLKRIRRSERACHVYALIAILILMHTLLLYPERYLIWSGHERIFDLLRGYYAVLIVSLLILFALKLHRGLSPELMCLMAYSGWMLITRIAVHDYTLFGELYFSALCFLIFAAGSFLRREQRWRLLEISGCVLGTILCVYAVFAVIAVYSGDSVIPGLTKYISLHRAAVSDISFFGTIRTLSASWFGLGLMMFVLLYSYYRERGKRVRFLCIPASVLMLFVVAHQHCRSITVAVSLNAALLCLLCLMPKVRTWKKPARLLTAALLFCILSVVFYKGIGTCGDLLLRSAPVFAPETSEQVTASPSPAAPFPAAETSGDHTHAETKPQSSSDARIFLRDLLTLTERTEIWGAGLKAIAEDPSIALFGQKEEGMMLAVNRQASYTEVKQHMHNTHMQALMLTGVPGFLCQLAFSILLLSRMIGCCLSPEAETSEKLMTLFLLAAMMYGFMEMLMNRGLAFPTLWYLLVAGIFVENRREEKKKQQE